MYIIFSHENLITIDNLTNVFPLTIWSGGHDTLDCFFWQLNYKEPKIQFTIEREINDILAFLDISIHRLADRLVTKVYRKETHPEIYPLALKSVEKLQTRCFERSHS